jgi:hypothetical protein
LVVDVTCTNPHRGLADAFDEVTSGPVEFLGPAVPINFSMIGVPFVAESAFQGLHDVRYRKDGRIADEQMDMIAIRAHRQKLALMQFIAANAFENIEVDAFLFLVQSLLTVFRDEHEMHIELMNVVVAATQTARGHGHLPWLPSTWLPKRLRSVKKPPKSELFGYIRVCRSDGLQQKSFTRWKSCHEYFATGAAGLTG